MTTNGNGGSSSRTTRITNSKDNIKIATSLSKSLYFGYRTPDKAIEGLQLNSSSNARLLPITTRSIGFSTQAIFNNIHKTLNENDLPDCSMYQAYRVSLAQAELKIKNSTEQVLDCEVANDQIVQPTITTEHESIIKAAPINFNIISNFINAIGTFEHDRIVYYSRIPNIGRVDPTTVTYSNLERYVNYLSNRESDVIDRIRFYNNCPLPGAIWDRTVRRTVKRRHLDYEHEDFNPVLLNPQDFWPPEYTLADFQNDSVAYRKLLSQIDRSTLRYVNIESKINFEGPGNKNVLISNIVDGNVNNPPILHLPDTQDIDWNSVRLPTGTIEHFWSPTIIDQNTAYLGMLILSGEIYQSLTNQDIFSVRTIENCGSKLNHDWVTAFRSVMN